jgi:hypothetical protein
VPDLFGCFLDLVPPNSVAVILCSFRRPLLFFDCFTLIFIVAACLQNPGSSLIYGLCCVMILFEY